MIDVTVVNSYILYKHHVPVATNKFDYKTFRLELAKELIAGYHCRQRYRIPFEIYDMVEQKRCTRTKRKSIDDTAGHFPIKEKRRKSTYCWNIRGVRHESTVSCRKCGVALCVSSYNDEESSCFEKYHEL